MTPTTATPNETSPAGAAVGPHGGHDVVAWQPSWRQAITLWFVEAVRAAPTTTLTLCLTTIVGALAPPLGIWGMSQIVDALVGGRSIWPGIWITLGSLLVGNLASSLAEPIGSTVRDQLVRHIRHRLSQIAGRIPTLAIEDSPAIADRVKLLDQFSYRMGSLQALLQPIAALTSAATLVVLLAGVHPVLLLLILAALVPAVVGVIQWIKQESAFNQVAPFWRIQDSMIELMTDPRNGLDVRCFGMIAPLRSVIANAMYRVVRPIDVLVQRFALYGLGAWLVWMLAQAGALVWLVQRAMAGQTSVSQVSLVLMLSMQIATTAQALASTVRVTTSAVGDYLRLGWLDNCARALDDSHLTRRVPQRLSQGIELREVSFTYSGAQSPSLSEINLSIPAGTTVALVGNNGAGKTTLVKLLTKLHLPTTGEILIDDQPLSEVSSTHWRQRLSAGFQDFARLEFTARETVEVGDLGSPADADRLDHAMTMGQASSVIEALQQGWDTQLGTRFEGGVNLSGGQWQRLALARAFMRQEPLLMLLDEPTAALDPEAEHAIYEAYAEHSRALAQRTGAITVLVSHRFSTVRMADLIVVVDEGRIAETGTHAELLAQNGRYAALYRTQADAYR